MKEFIKYSRLKRLTNINNLTYLRSLAAISIFMFFNIYFFTGPEHTTSLTTFGIIMFFSIGPLISNTNYDKKISLRNGYPIDTRKRQIYDFLYIVLYAIFSVFILLIIFVILGLAFGDVGDDTFIDEGPFIEDKSLYYKHAFNYSIFFFYYFLSSVRSNKRWWLTLMVGILSYFILNTLTRYVLIGEAFKRITINLTDYSNIIKSIYYFSVIGILFISIFIFIVIHNYNKKPKKNIINN